jgi:hypothetical protein
VYSSAAFFFSIIEKELLTNIGYIFKDNDVYGMCVKIFIFLSEESMCAAVLIYITLKKSSKLYLFTTFFIM